MEKKQSSIEWLFEKLDIVDSSIMFVYFEQAKAMHKEEIEDAYRISPNNALWSNSGIDYYNETFGGNNEN